MRNTIVHILFWLIFFLIWQRVVYFYIDNPANRFLFSTFDVGLIIFTFYIIFNFITPLFINRSNKISFLLGFLCTAGATGFLLQLIMNLFIRRNIVQIEFRFSWQYTDLVANRYFIALLGATAGLVTKLSINWFKIRRKNEMAYKEQISSELMYLKAQLNPHFLFNALNTIYIQMDLSKEDAKHSLSTFSQMLRYQLYECNTESTAIEKEIDYIQNYILLQRLRADEKCSINFTYGDSLKNFQIAPLLLFPFIENMFKHVSADAGKETFITGELTYSNECLLFHSINSKETTTTLKSDSGIGLMNTKRRLELIYPEKHELVINKSDTTFEIWLKIQISA